MKYILNHKDGLIELSVSKSNAYKNRIENDRLIARECGDCKRFLDMNLFDSRVRNGKRQKTIIMNNQSQTRPGSAAR